jgi:hypothetical protein
LDGGIGLLLDQFAQPLHIDLYDGDASHGKGRALAGLTPTLFDASSPGRADLEHLRNSLGLHAAVIGSQHTVTQFLRIGFGHP